MSYAKAYTRHRARVRVAFGRTDVVPTGIYDSPSDLGQVFWSSYTDDGNPGNGDVFLYILRIKDLSQPNVPSRFAVFSLAPSMASVTAFNMSSSTIRAELFGTMYIDRGDLERNVISRTALDDMRQGYAWLQLGATAAVSLYSIPNARYDNAVLVVGTNMPAPSDAVLVPSKHVYVLQPTTQRLRPRQLRPEPSPDVPPSSPAFRRTKRKTREEKEEEGEPVAKRFKAMRAQAHAALQSAGLASPSDALVHVAAAVALDLEHSTTADRTSVFYTALRPVQPIVTLASPEACIQPLAMHTRAALHTHLRALSGADSSADDCEHLASEIAHAIMFYTAVARACIPPHAVAASAVEAADGDVCDLQDLMEAYSANMVQCNSVRGGGKYDDAEAQCVMTYARQLAAKYV